jgi:hypothetical protein
VPSASSEPLEGTTLSVYLYIVRKGVAVGPRDAMNGVRLSSPSVAYRHLQKLEDLGLLRKNEHGEYVAKGRARVRGYLWVGRRVVPKMLVYSLLFLSILVVEVVVLGIHFAVENYEFKVFFLLLILVTGLAMSVFVVEGLLQRKRTRLSFRSEQANNSV